MPTATCSSATAIDASVRIRGAQPCDAAAIEAIYAREVLHGTASYEVEPPGVDAMAERMAAGGTTGHPWRVAMAGDAIAGYAYASPYRTRPGYRWTVEDSVYVAPAFQRLGVGAALLADLVERCTALGFRQMVAVIGDESNRGSVLLHERLGFQVVGRFPGIGRKHGRWLTGVQMMRALGEGASTAPFAEPEPAA